MPSILIIDDDKLVREAMQILLRAKGYDVTAAGDGISGIAAAAAAHFDLAIVDLLMPDMDGLKVMAALRQSNPAMPMIAASGFLVQGDCPPMPDLAEMAGDVGAVFTLHKPFKPSDILGTVVLALNAA